MQYEDTSAAIEEAGGVFHSRMLLIMRDFKSSCTLQVYCDYGGQELAHKYVKLKRMMNILM